MGYYINVLQKGAIYELNGEYIKFVKKDGNLFYFYSCKRLNPFDFSFTKLNEVCIYTEREIYYIKKVNDCAKKGQLKKIGKEKVFPRN